MLGKWPCSSAELASGHPEPVFRQVPNRTTNLTSPPNAEQLRPKRRNDTRAEILYLVACGEPFCETARDFVRPPKEPGRIWYIQGVVEKHDSFLHDPSRSFMVLHGAA